MGAVHYPDNDPKHEPPPIKEPWRLRDPFSANIPFLDDGRCFLNAFLVVRRDSSVAGLGLLKMEYIARHISHFWWKRSNLLDNSPTEIFTRSTVRFLFCASQQYC
jgi:hypothetical protein